MVFSIILYFLFPLGHISFMLSCGGFFGNGKMESGCYVGAQLYAFSLFFWILGLCYQVLLVWHQPDHSSYRFNVFSLFPMDSWAPLNMNRSRFTRRLITLLHYQNISIPTIPSSSKRNQQMMSRHGGANRILRYELLEFNNLLSPANLL